MTELKNSHRPKLTRTCLFCLTCFGDNEGTVYSAVTLMLTSRAAMKTGGQQTLNWTTEDKRTPTLGITAGQWSPVGYRNHLIYIPPSPCIFCFFPCALQLQFMRYREVSHGNYKNVWWNIQISSDGTRGKLLETRNHLSYFYTLCSVFHRGVPSEKEQSMQMSLPFEQCCIPTNKSDFVSLEKAVRHWVTNTF